MRAAQLLRPGRTVQPRTTLWLDLRPEEETLLASFKQKWRYNVRLAQRKGVTVREGTVGDLPAFVALMQTTGDRNDFAVHSPAYYRRFWELFAPPGRAALLLAEAEGQVLAGLMVAHLAGRAYYLSGLRQRGATAHAQSPATVGNDALGTGAGLHGLHLWGVPDEVAFDPEDQGPDAASGLWGVWRFKRGFGGQVVRYMGAWDRAYAPLVLRAQHMLRVS